MDFIKLVLATGPNHWNALIPLQSSLEINVSPLARNRRRQFARHLEFRGAQARANPETLSQNLHLYTAGRELKKHQFREGTLWAFGKIYQPIFLLATQ